MAKNPKPYEPPTYGVRNLAIERRLAGKPPASMKEEEEAKSEEAAPENKAITGAPANKSTKSKRK